MYLTEWTCRVWIVSLSLNYGFCVGALVFCGLGQWCVWSLVASTQDGGECAQKKNKTTSNQFNKTMFQIQSSSRQLLPGEDLCDSKKNNKWELLTHCANPSFFPSYSCFQAVFQQVGQVSSVWHRSWGRKENPSLNSSTLVTSLLMLPGLTTVVYLSTLLLGDVFLFHTPEDN